MAATRATAIVLLFVALTGAAFAFAGCDDGGSDPTPTPVRQGTPVLGEDPPTPTPVPDIAPTAPATLAAQPTVTESGLQVIDIEIGDGEPVLADQPTQAVTVHYTGWLAENGMKFNSSVDLGQPTTLQVGDFIAGWQEGLVGMRVGGMRRLVVPPELAYGAEGFPPDIGPNATLIFDIELIDVQ